MKLFLCAHSIYPDIQEEFEDFVNGKCQDLSVAFVTTAANLFQDRSWELEDIDFVKNLFKSVDLYDIENMSPEEMLDTFSKYDILWVNGGDPVYLISKMRDSCFLEVLPETLENTVYVGSSAGSMVWSKNIETTGMKGLGVLDFQIHPHYKGEEVDRRKGDEYWLMSNGQAISYEDGEIKKYGGDIVILPKE